MKQVASMQQSGIEDLLTRNTSISLRYIEATCYRWIAASAKDKTYLDNYIGNYFALFNEKFYMRLTKVLLRPTETKLISADPNNHIVPGIGTGVGTASKLRLASCNATLPLLIVMA